MSEPKRWSDAVEADFLSMNPDLDPDYEPPRLVLVPGSENWTDEQWAEHDARIEARRAEEEREEARERERALVARMSDAGWPRRAIEAAQAADAKKPAVERVLRWDSDSECVLVLSGPPGCGKTTAACVWALRRSWPPAFLRATTFAASSRYDHERRSGWLNANALVLDDLGSEYADAKGNFLVDLDELVDTFYGDKRPLIITTNCQLEDFKSRYGARIVDRLRECGSWYSVNGQSLRRKA